MLGEMNDRWTGRGKTSETRRRTKVPEQRPKCGTRSEDAAGSGDGRQVAESHAANDTSALVAAIGSRDEAMLANDEAVPLAAVQNWRRGDGGDVEENK